MNTATANSMLKNLEEPPAGAVFLLVSHRPARLLPTIRSRCVSVPVPVPDAKAAAAWLGAQGVRNAERWLAFAGGAPLRALEYATGERGEDLARVLRGIASGNRAALGAVKGREELEPRGSCRKWPSIARFPRSPAKVRRPRDAVIHAHGSLGARATGR